MAACEHCAYTTDSEADLEDHLVFMARHDLHGRA